MMDTMKMFDYIGSGRNSGRGESKKKAKAAEATDENVMSE